MTPVSPDRTSASLRPSSPWVDISISALRTNLRAVVSTAADAVIDVRADAWGHGVSEVARAALDAGAAALLVDEHGVRALSHEVDHAALTLDRPAVAPDAVYGLSDGFRPVMSFRGRVSSVKRLRAGEGVSYGYTHRASRDTVVALVTGGYAQGVLRALGSAVSVSIGGIPHRVIGRVAMDVCVVDVGEALVARGEEVVFFGDEDAGAPPLSEWSAATGLTPAELVTAIGLRNDREYVA